MRKTTLSWIVLAALLAFSLASTAATRAEFDQWVLALQANPSDNALRERIIKASREMNPQPAIPEEARRHFIEGTMISKTAKDAAQQRLAVASFAEALKLAPWWGDAYYNMAVAQELAGDFNGAISSLRFYLLTGPSDKDARQAQDRIYALNAKARLAQPSPMAPASPSPAVTADKLAGEWNSFSSAGVLNALAHWQLVAEGGQLLWYSIQDRDGTLQAGFRRLEYRVAISGPRFTMLGPVWAGTPPPERHECEVNAALDEIRCKLFFSASTSFATYTLRRRGR